MRISNFLLLCLAAALYQLPLSQAHDGPHPLVNLTGDWVITFKVLQAGGDCAVGVVSVENTTLTHNVATGEVEVRGVLDDPNEVVIGHVSENEEGDIIFTYEGQFREDGGWTERSVELVVAEDWETMEGFEDWEWGLSSNPNAPDECPNSRSSLSAVRGGPGAPPVTTVPQIYSFTKQLDRATRMSEKGRGLMSLWDQFEAEFYLILLGNPEIGGEALNVAGDLVQTISSSGPVHRISHTEVGSGGALGNTFNVMQPALASLMSGNGDGAMISQEMVDSAQDLVDMVKEKASDGLKAALELESNPLSDLQQFVGKSFNESVVEFGIDPANLSIVAYEPTRHEAHFEVSVDNLQGVSFSLAKTTSLENPVWEEVSGLIIEEIENNRLRLTDPNPGSVPAFYRINTLEDGSGDPL